MLVWWRLYTIILVRICADRLPCECVIAFFSFPDLKMYFHRISLYDVYLSQIIITLVFYDFMSIFRPGWIECERGHPGSQATVSFFLYEVSKLTIFPLFRWKSGTSTGKLLFKPLRTTWIISILNSNHKLSWSLNQSQTWIYKLYNYLHFYYIL